MVMRMNNNKKIGLYFLVAVGIILYCCISFIFLYNTNNEILKLTSNTQNKSSQNESTNGSIILQFNVSECGVGDYADPYNQSQLGIKEVHWLDNTSASIKAYVSLNCDEWVEGPSYYIHNNTIHLTYYVGNHLPLTANCNCVHILRYTFSNLQSENYNFELAEPINNNYPINI